MRYSFKNIELFSYNIIFYFIFLVAGCGTSMQVVEKSLEDGDFVPEQALSTIDFLNEYHHHLPQPKNAMMGIDIAFERDNVLVSGDELYAQIALTTKSPTLKANNIHVLVYNPTDLSESSLKKIRKTVDEIGKRKSTLPKGSTLTVDWYEHVNTVDNTSSTLLKNSADMDLVAFLRQYARLSPNGEKHHYILILGDHADISHEQKQNITDIASILQVKSATLSVLATDVTPEVAFLNKLAEKGNGVFSLVSNNFDYDVWLENETNYINAEKISDVKLAIYTQGRIEISEVKSPGNLYTTGKSLNHTVSKLIQGDQYAIVLNLKIPVLNEVPYKDVIRVDVDYYDNSNSRYVRLSKSATVNFVDDRNKTLASRNHNVQRSLLILNTQKVLTEITPFIQNKRYYQAIALLTEQSQKLEKFGTAVKDKELLRDVGILNQYSEKLYAFDETAFQTLKIWHDLSLDTSRYSESFN